MTKSNLTARNLSLQAVYFEISFVASWSDIYLYFTLTSQKASTEIFTLAQTV